MQNNGPKRVYRARIRRQPWPMIWAWTLAVIRQKKKEVREGMTKYKVLISITDINKFSELIFDILKDKESPQEIENFLNEDYPEEGLQTLKSIAQNGYPLSLEGLQ